MIRGQVLKSAKDTTTKDDLRRSSLFPIAEDSEFMDSQRFWKGTGRNKYADREKATTSSLYNTYTIYHYITCIYKYMHIHIYIYIHMIYPIYYLITQLYMHIIDLYHSCIFVFQNNSGLFNDHHAAFVDQTTDGQ